MIRPVCAESFSEALEIAVALFNTLKTMLKERGLSCAVGDEGGFVPALPGGTEDILDLMMLATEKTGFAPGEDIRIALDCASSEYFNGESYDYTVFEGERGAIRTQAEQIEYLEKLIKSYPVDSIEDGMAENDWQGWKAMTSLLGEKCQLVGDDIFVTNPGLLQKGIDNAVGNAILIKPNQIGTLTETFETIELAKKFGYLPIISHRSGETSDTAIADIAVASGAGQIKAGSVSP
jgi:enolase